MRNVIGQSVVFQAPAEELFAMYLDPVVHGAITGAAVTIGDRPGDEFRAFDGMLTGTILEVVAPRLIVQSWRSAHFNADDADSTLILCFSSAGDVADREGSQGRIDLIHLDVPQHDYDAVVAGWEKYYWTPWRAYLAGE